MSKTYAVQVWCSDCLGEDPQGCFEGGRETLGERFSSEKEAKTFADEYIDSSDCPLYEARVIEVSP